MKFNLFYISPELILALGGLMVLAVGLAARRGRKLGIISPEILSLAVLAGALVPTIMFFSRAHVMKGIPQFVLSGMKSGMMAVDGLAVFFKIIAILSTAIVIFLSMEYFKGLDFHRGEYYALLIFATLAITMLAASTDLIMIYLSLEFLSITSYVLVGYMKKDPKSNEAAVKYFLYGSIAAAVMLYGMSILYGFTGTTNILSIAESLLSYTLDIGPTHILFLATLFVLVGFGFKVSMVPFHHWAPDAYEGAPTPITAFLSVGSKAAGFAVIARVLATSIRPDVLWWAPLVMILSGVTMTIGNLVAIPQMNIKRMLAYSSIAQAGYILLGISAMAYTPTALTAVIIYIFIYLFMNLGAFTVVTLLSAKLKSDHLKDYAGLIRRAPIHAVALAVFLLSLAGIPPTAGFLAKFYLFLAAVNAQDNQILWLTIVALANTVISIYYYMNVARLMFFREPASLEPIPQSRPLNFVLGLTLAMTFIILLYPRPFIRLAEMSARIFTG